MSKTFVYEVKVDSGNSVKTLNSLETELKDINNQLKDAEVNSDAFNKLASQSRLLEGEIASLNNQVKGLNLEDKLRAGDGAIKILAGSTQTLIGSLGILGVESEALGKFEEKAASAIAIGMGVKDLSEGFGQLTQVMAKLPGPTKIATAAQRVFNTVLKANPIGLIITAITIVVGLFLVFNKRIQEAIKTFEPLNKLVEGAVGLFRKFGQALGLVASDAELLAQKQRDLAKATADNLSDTLRIQRALGNDTVELERKILNERIKSTEEYSDERKKAVVDLQVFEAEQIKKARDEEEKRSQEALKKQQEANQRAIEIAKERQSALDEIRRAEVVTVEEQLAFDIGEINKQYDELAKSAKRFGLSTEKLEAARQARILQLTEDFNKKLLEIEEERTKAVRTVNEELEALSVEFIFSEEARKEEARRKEIEDVTKQYELLKQQAQQLSLDTQQIEIERDLAIESIKDRNRLQDLEVEKQQRQTIADILFDIDKQTVERLDAETQRGRDERFRIRLEELEQERAAQLTRLQELGASEQEILNVKQFYASEEVRITAEKAEQEKLIEQAKNQAILGAAGGLFGSLSQLVGEQSKAGKAFAVGDSIIQTYLGVARALGSAPPPINFITAASVAAAGIANVRKILSTQVGGGATATPTAPNIPRGNAVNPAQFATAQTPDISQFSTGFGINNQQFQTGQPVRAYVVTGDVRSGLEAENKIRTRRTVGRPE